MSQASQEAQLKALAASIKASAQTLGIEISHAQALELIARTGGASNWITAKHILAAKAAEIPQGERSAVIEAWDSSRYGGDRKNSTQHEVTVNDHLESAGAIFLDASVSAEIGDTISTSIEVSAMPMKDGRTLCTVPVVRVHRGDDCIASIYPTGLDKACVILSPQGVELDVLDEMQAWANAPDPQVEPAAVHHAGVNPDGSGLSRRVAWWLIGLSEEQRAKAPVLLDEASVEHVNQLLRQDYTSGELFVADPKDPDVTYRGWWEVAD